jgi:hypothetical protein
MKGGACGASARGLNSTKGPNPGLAPGTYVKPASRHMTTAMFRTLLPPSRMANSSPRITAVVAGEDLDLAARRPHTIVVARQCWFRAIEALKLNIMLDAPRRVTGSLV